jgi:Leucine-rich repeat (LRR) protein
MGTTIAMQINCTYFINKNLKNLKTCLVTNLSLVIQTDDLRFTGTFEEKDTTKMVQIIDSRTSVVPKQIFKTFVNITVLEIVNVGLKNIYKSTFRHANKLKKFFAAANFIEYIPDRTFIGCPNLTKLELQYNMINTIEPKAFVGLTKLRLLKLERNKISFLSDDSFQSLASLQQIYLQDNQILKISERLFEKNVKLTLIDLQNNIIEHIGSYAFENNPELEKIVLLNNKCVNKEFVGLKDGQVKKIKLELRKCYEFKSPQESSRLF